MSWIKKNPTSSGGADHTHANKFTLDKFGESNGSPTFNGVAIGNGDGGDSFISTPPNVLSVDTFIDASVLSNQGFFYPIIGMYDVQNMELTAGSATLEFTIDYASSPTQLVDIKDAKVFESSSSKVYPVSSITSSTVSGLPIALTNGMRVKLSTNVSSSQFNGGFLYWVLKIHPTVGDTGTRYTVHFKDMVFKINGVEVPKYRLLGATSHTVFTVTHHNVKVNRSYGQTNAVLPSRWRGKTVLFYGDSITASSTGGGVGPRYPQIVANILGVAVAEDRAASGMAIVNPANTLQSRMYMHQNFDLITIALGFNDYSFGVPLGAIGAWGDTAHDVTTFYGGYRWCLDQIQGKNPYATIVLMIPIWTGNSGANSQGLKIDDYREAIRKIAFLYNLPVYESSLGINKWNKDIFVADGAIHIGDQGHWRYADHLGSFLANL